MVVEASATLHASLGYRASLYVPGKWRHVVVPIEAAQLWFTLGFDQIAAQAMRATLFMPRANAAGTHLLLRVPDYAEVALRPYSVTLTPPQARAMLRLPEWNYSGRDSEALQRFMDAKIRSASLARRLGEIRLQYTRLQAQASYMRQKSREAAGVGTE